MYICKSINIIHHINKRKVKNHTITSIFAEKAFGKAQDLFMIKTLKKVGVERAYFNIIKAIYEKPIANIILNRWKLKAFPLRSGIRQECPLSPLLFNIVLEVLAIAIRQENKRHPNWKRENKSAIICRWHDSVHRKSYRLHQKLLIIISRFGKMMGHKVNIQKSKTILYTNNETAETEIRKKKSHLI